MEDRIEDAGKARLVCFNRGITSKLPLFFVHGADGLADIFGPLAERLDADRPVYGVRAQGVDGGLPPVDQIEIMARAYVAMIEQIDPHGPYILGGHSGGGVIAYEMAQQLREAGRQVALIIMLDTVDPRDLSRPVSMKERLMLVPKAHPEILLEWPINRIRDLRSFIYRSKVLGDEETPRDAVGAAYIRAQALYQPLPYPGDVLVIKAKRARAHYIRSGRALGWDKLVTGALDVFATEGQHLTLFREPALSNIARAITAKLTQIEPSAASMLQEPSRPIETDEV